MSRNILWKEYSGLSKKHAWGTPFAIIERNKEAVRNALMLDLLMTAAVCSPAEISALFDEMWEAERPYLQAFE